MDVIVVDDGSINDPIDIIEGSNWNGLEVKYIKNEKIKVSGHASIMR